jgi:mono/diheme cytochrome c family protein
MKFERLSILIGMSLLVSLAGVESGAQTQQDQQVQSTEQAAANPYQGDPKAIEEGRQIFSTYGCAGCHGAGGGGGMGRSLTDDAWKFGGDDQTLFRLVHGDIPDQTMPKFGPFLSEEQIWKVIAFVRTLKASGEVPATGQANILLEERSCRIALANRALLKQVLPNVSDYQSTYVMISHNGITSLDSLRANSKQEQKIGVHSGEPTAEIIEKYQLKNLTNYELDLYKLGDIVTDVYEKKIDAAIVWAPIAGFFALETDKERKLKMVSVSESASPPAMFGGQTPSETGYVGKCATVVGFVLQLYGIQPVKSQSSTVASGQPESGHN